MDGLILPDLPLYEFETVYRGVLQQYGLDFIFLVTPETSDARVQQIDRLSSGFLYAVSSSSTTGGQQTQDKLPDYLLRLRGLSLKNPIMVGFGIKDKESFRAAARQANGAIIGTAYIKALEHSTDLHAATRQFLASIIG